MHDPSPSTPSAHGRALAILIGLSLTLAATTGFLWIERRAQDPAALLEVAKRSSSVQAEAIAALVEGAEGVWDAHPDAQVARIMQPDVAAREFRGVPVSSNAFGLREAAFEARKPAGVTRIVLLGDSFVFGYKVRAQDRLGVFLQGFLEERGVGGEVECLHLAISSWNILSETSYLRRQLHDLQPDLVVQVIISNDLDDTRGPRGFGAIGNYSPQQRARAGGLVSNLTPPGLWPTRIQGYLLYHLDHQSRTRYAAAASQIQSLASAVESQGGKYVLMSAWETYSPMVQGYLAGALREDQLIYISSHFTSDLRYRIDAGDRHWNRAGHEKIAQLIYGLARKQRWLPALELSEWPLAQAALQEIHLPGSQEASYVSEYQALLLAKAQKQIGASIDFTELTRLGAKQVHAGIFEEGRVAPYASMILANPAAETLEIEGLRHGSPALQGARARVFLEGLEVGQIPLWADSQDPHFELSFAVPAELREREFLSVSLESEDYVYEDLASGRCQAFQLQRIALR